MLLMGVWVQPYSDYYTHGVLNEDLMVVTTLLKLWLLLMEVEKGDCSYWYGRFGYLDIDKYPAGLMGN
jgi:hypothetical protein